MSDYAVEDGPGSPPALRPSRGNMESTGFVMDFSGPQDFVTITASKDGLGELTSTVHKTLICKQSPYFDATFNRSFKESETGMAVLSDIEPTIFRMVVNWLYYQGLKHSDSHPVSLVEYVKLWKLADRFLMPRLQNEAMAGLINAVGFRYITHANKTNEKLAESIAEVFEYVYDDADEHPEMRPPQLVGVCVDVLLPQWNIGSRSQETVNKLYEKIFGPGKALDIVKSMISAGVNYTSLERPAIENFFVDTGYKNAEDNGETRTSRRRVFSEGATP